jgi:hypothetical protein
MKSAPPVAAPGEPESAGPAASADLAPQAQSGSNAAQLVRALLERHGIPRHRHSSFVGEFFGLSRAASYLRVNKSSAWTLDEFQALADRFGEPLAQVLGAIGGSALGTPAVFKVGTMQIGCRVWLDRNSSASPANALVAMEAAGSYVVVPYAAAVGQACWPVARLEITDASASVPRVAVLDDERDVTESVCGILRSDGIEAVPYFKAEDLARDIPKGLFDGYVIDWLLPGNQNAVPLLAAVRDQPRRSALVLLTGKTRAGTADPAEVGAAAGRFRAQLVEKPVQGPFLLSSLQIDGLGGAAHVPALSVPV